MLQTVTPVLCKQLIECAGLAHMHAGRQTLKDISHTPLVARTHEQPCIIKGLDANRLSQPAHSARAAAAAEAAAASANAARCRAP